MTHRATLAPAVLSLALLAACHPHPDLAAHGGGSGPGTWRGGEPTPASVGVPPTGAAAGTAISAFLHSDTVANLHPSDRPHIELALIRAHNAMPGHVVRWTNPATGGHGVAKPSPARRTPDGRPCLDMQQDFISAGTEHHTVTTACRLPDGTWAREAAPWK